MQTLTLSAAFLAAILGSLHCVGMCGPIVLALPKKDKSKFAAFISRFVFNLGRIFTYSVLGLIVGYLGSKISLFGYQQILSIILGSAIILYYLLPNNLKSKLYASGLVSRFTSQITKGMRKFLGDNRLLPMFILGTLNGLLPCGFLYLILASASITGSAFNGFLVMFFFGLGTLPSMYSVSVAGGLLNYNLKQKFIKLIPAYAIVLALLLILRGLNLGIPYVSPKTPGTAIQSGCEHCK